MAAWAWASCSTRCRPAVTLTKPSRRYRFLLGVSREDSPLGAEVRRAFWAVTDLVRAAQQAGEIKDGDVKHISALIFGAAYGMADLAVSNRERGCPGSGTAAA